jgi:hypothetical protein
MKHRIIVGGLFLVSLILVGVGYIYSNPIAFGLCHDARCGGVNDIQLFAMGFPLYKGLRYFPLLFLSLIFVRKEVFSTWWKIMLPVGLLQLLIVLQAPAIAPNILSIDRQHITLFMVLVASGLSAIIVVCKHILL